MTQDSRCWVRFTELCGVSNQGTRLGMQFKPLLASCGWGLELPLVVPHCQLSMPGCVLHPRRLGRGTGVLHPGAQVEGQVSELLSSLLPREGQA